MVSCMASNFEDIVSNGLSKFSIGNLLNHLRKHKVERKFIKNWFASNKLEKIRPFLNALEVQSRVFNGQIFIQDDPEIKDKLSRLGFFEIAVFCKKYPSLEQHLFLPKTLGESLYNEEFHIEINLVPAKHWVSLNIAVDIAQKANLGAETGWKIFLISYHRLLEQ